MKKIFIQSFFFSSALTFLLPVLVFAQTQATLSISANLPGVTANVTNPGAWINGFYTLALMLGGVLAFGAVVYGGVLYAASAGNPSKQSEGKDWILSALLGLLLLAGAYLVLNTINPDLTNIAFPTLTSVGTGNVASNNPGNILSSTGGFSAGSFSPGIAGTATENAVSLAAISYYRVSTANALGTNNGADACAYAVNQVLAQAGIAPPLGSNPNSVQSMETALTQGRGTLITDTSQAQPGDIVIQAGDSHVGICMNVGCTQVLSNSTTNKSFSWVSNTSFSPSYSAGPGRIYQVNH